MTTELDHEALISGLYDIHLPAEAAGGWVAELAAATGLAALLALVVGMGLRALSERRAAPPPSRPLSARVADLDALPREEQQTALLHILKSTHPARFSSVKTRLYRGDAELDLEHLRNEVLRD